MQLPLCYYGHPTLRKKAQRIDQIDEKLQQLIDDMIETMAIEDGVGIAAPQVGHSIALFVINVPTLGEDKEVIPGVPRVFINPKILEYSQESWLRGEACLSIPGLYGTVERPLRVRIAATDRNGQPFEQEFIGLEARVILHENDHLNGVLFIDRMRGKERKDLEQALRQIKKKYSK